MSRSATDIQLDLDTFHALRRTCGTTGIAEYTVESGQGRQSTKRYTLKEINDTIRQLEAELLDATNDGNTYSAGYNR